MENTVIGVKFKTKIINSSFDIDDRLKELKKWCKIFNDKGLAPAYEYGTFGNLSFRVNENSFIITASQCGNKDCLSDDQFVLVNEVDLENQIISISGKCNPSSETMIHYSIYKTHPEINAVFHGHCDYISTNAEELNIPITSQEEPYGTIALVNRVLEKINDNNLIQMKNHGFISIGKTMNDAGNLVLNLLKNNN